MISLGWVKRCFWIGVASGLLIGSVGCGTGAESYVEGRVTLDGNPLEHGRVVFSPSGGGATSGASGQITSGGYYKLKTGKTLGLKSGKYAVTVSSRERSVSTGPGPPAPGKPITPKKYGSTSESGLEFEIDRGSNTIDLELSSS